MRILYYVPMIHTNKELDEVGTIISILRVKIYGQESAKYDEEQIEELWRTIRVWVLRTIKDVSGLIIYQDGIPVGPREKIRQLFKLVLAEHSQSPLFQLTKELIDRGAILEGTEDIHLLTKRAAVYKEIYQATTQCQDLKDVEEFIIKRVTDQDDLILQADRFIAKRINETLPENEKGILFMGHRHKVDEEIVKMREARLLSTPIEIRKSHLTILSAMRRAD